MIINFLRKTINDISRTVRDIRMLETMNIYKSFQLFIISVCLSGCNQGKMTLNESHEFVLQKLQDQLLDSPEFIYRRKLSKRDSARTYELDSIIYRSEQLPNEQMIPLLQEQLEYGRISSISFELLLSLKIAAKQISKDQASLEWFKFDSARMVWLDQHSLREDINLLKMKDSADYKYFAKLADVLLEHEEFESSIVAYTKCETVEPMYQGARVRKALAKYKLGRTSEACKDWITQGSESPGNYEKYCK